MAIKGVKTKLTDTDEGAKALYLRLLGASEISLSVGIHADAGAQRYAPPRGQKDEGVTMVELAEIHEFGLGVPQRSFLGTWFDENQPKMVTQLRGVMLAVASEKIESYEQGFEQLGLLYTAQIQKRIAEGIEPPLSPITIARKGSSVPLIDTGQLRSAITYKVDSKNGVREGGGAEAGTAE